MRTGAPGPLGGEHHAVRGRLASVSKSGTVRPEDANAFA